MPLDLAIDPDALAQITELPDQVRAVIEEAQAALDAAGAAAGGNPLAALPGALGGLADLVGDLPALDGLAGLADLLPDAPIDGTEVGAAIERLTGLLGPLAEVLAGDDLEGAMAGAVAQAGEIGAQLVPRGDEVTAVLAQLQELLGFLGALDGWGPSTPAPEVARLLARALVGAGPDLLDAPAAALDAATAAFQAVVAIDDPALATWMGAGADQLQAWVALEGRLDGAGPLDWHQVEAAVQAASRSLLEATAARDRLIAGAVEALGRLDGAAFAPVATALLAVPEVAPAQLTPILDGMRRQLEGMRDELQAWTPDPADARRLVRRAVELLLDAIAQSPLGQIRGALLGLEQRVIAALDALPLRGLARQLTEVLADVAAAVTELDLAALRRPLDDLAAEVRQRLDAISSDALQGAIGDVWSAVEAAVREAAGLLEDLQQALTGVTGALGDFVGQVEPLMADLTATLQQIGDGLADFDLAEPAGVVVDLLHEARDLVAGIDVSSLPGPLVSMVDTAAQALAEVDLMASVRDPLDELLAEVDPTPLLDAALAGLRDVTEELSHLDPASIAAALDAPFEALLDGLATVDPGALRDLVDEALAPARDAVGALDPATLLGPASATFTALLVRLDEACDPARILAPLQELYQPVVDLVDGLDPGRLIGLLVPHAGSIVESVGPAAGPPAAVTESGGALADLPSGVDADDDLFGFRPGDLLVPAIDLHARLLAALDALDESVVEEVGEALHRAFAGRLAALSPARVLGQLDEALDAIDASLGAVATAARLADAARAHHRTSGRLLAAAADVGDDDPSAPIAARVTINLPSLDPLRLVPTLAQTDALALAIGAARARVDLTALQSAYGARAPRLRAVLPAGLDAGPLAATGLREVLVALDPAPVRDEVNAIFDDVGRALVGLQDVLTAALEEAGQAAEELLLPLNPTTLVSLASRVHAALAAEVRAVSPAALAEMVGLPHAAVRQQLAALDPAALAEPLEEVRAGLLGAVDGLATSLLPDAGPLEAIQAELATLRPSLLLADVTEALAPVTDLLATLDPEAIVRPLLDRLLAIRDQIPSVLADVESAFDEVLAAFPSGGASGDDGSTSIGG